MGRKKKKKKERSTVPEAKFEAGECTDLAPLAAAPLAVNSRIEDETTLSTCGEQKTNSCAAPGVILVDPPSMARMRGPTRTVLDDDFFPTSDDGEDSEEKNNSPPRMKRPKRKKESDIKETTWDEEDPAEEI